MDEHERVEVCSDCGEVYESFGDAIASDCISDCDGGFVNTPAELVDGI